MAVKVKSFSQLYAQAHKKYMYTCTVTGWAWSLELLLGPQVGTVTTLLLTTVCCSRRKPGITPSERTEGRRMRKFITVTCDLGVCWKSERRPAWGRQHLSKHQQWLLLAVPRGEGVEERGVVTHPQPHPNSTHQIKGWDTTLRVPYGYPRTPALLLGVCGLCKHNFEHNWYAKASSVMPA